MIDFEFELGVNFYNYYTKVHRFRSNIRLVSRCNKFLWLNYISNRSILFNDICKKCLSTFNAEEIEDLKSYLVLRKLKG